MLYQVADKDVPWLSWNLDNKEHTNIKYIICDMHIFKGSNNAGLMLLAVLGLTTAVKVVCLPSRVMESWDKDEASLF